MTEGITVQVNMYLCRRRLTGEYVLVTEGIIVFSDNVFMTAKVYRWVFVTEGVIVFQ